MSRMLEEALAAPGCVGGQLRSGEAEIRALAGYLRAHRPAFAVTVARGSSDHAANFARYLFETSLGLITASAAPSVVTIYGAKPAYRGALLVAISQSGESPDVIAVAAGARAQGAATVALVNARASPLSAACEWTIPLGAGEEESVAATKSFICSLAALARLTAHWAGDGELLAAFESLPARLQEAAACDWSAAVPVLVGAEGMLVIARGRTYPVAQAAALKLKETGALQAEPFSGAEVLHGPIAMVAKDYPVLLFATRDATLEGIRELASGLRAKGAHVLIAAADEATLELAATPLPLPRPLHPVLDPIVAIQAFYPFAARLAAARGHDPDRPRYLHKVTRTV